MIVLGIGGDIGVYAFLRAGHERYGWIPKVMSKVRTTFMKHSTLVEWIPEPRMDDPSAIVAHLNTFASEHPDHDLILFTNLDWTVRMLAENRDKLDSRWHIPLCDLDAFDRVSSKTTFARLCDDLGIRTPVTLDVGFTADAVAAGALTPADAVAEIQARGLEYPLIGKPAASADWFEVDFPGKLKIHHFASEAEVVDVLEHLAERKYPSEFLVQEFVPGDETHMRSITAYRSTRGEVTLLAGGQVLLEEHTPGTLGIPAAILTELDHDALDEARRFLDAADYTGFANFDYKVSSRTGERVFFEMNPRIGRNNFYVTAAGANVAEPVAHDLLGLPSSATASAGPTSPETQVLYSVVPFRLLSRYLLDPALKAKVTAAKKAHGLAHPLRYKADRSLKRRLWVRALDVRLARKYRTYYPEPTETGF